jgi:hypothetical protein
LPFKAEKITGERLWQESVSPIYYSICQFYSCCDSVCCCLFLLSIYIYIYYIYICIYINIYLYTYIYIYIYCIYKYIYICIYVFSQRWRRDGHRKRSSLAVKRSRWAFVVGFRQK